MPESLILRDRIFTPQSAIGGVIAIYHPGYPKDKGFLIGFVGYDTTNGGIWREVVTTACAILSNNRFDGWLAKDNIKNSQSIQSELLDAGDYYWHVQNGKCKAQLALWNNTKSFYRNRQAIWHPSDFPQLAFSSPRAYSQELEHE